MTSAEIYAQGFAIPTYDIDSGTRRWRFHDETIAVPCSAVPTRWLSPFIVARIEDVREAAKTMKGEYLG